MTSATPGVTWLHPDDNVNDTDGGEYVKFCCADIPAGEDFGIHQVELRVWDDGNMNGIVGDNQIINGSKDNFNTTWSDIRVENKIPPRVVCPPDVTITCDMTFNESIGKVTAIDTVDLTMTGYPVSIDVCSNLKVTYTDQGSLDVCRKGTITRTFTVTKGSQTATCTQKITITGIESQFNVRCNASSNPTAWDKCSFTLEDARDRKNSKIKRPIVESGPCDLIGENIKIDTFLFEDGACKKWRVTYTYINWCTGEESEPCSFYYAFKDNIAPVIVCNDQEFRAVPNPANPLGGCEGSVVLESSASDALVCADESWIKWQVFFDGWSNGTIDRIGSSFVGQQYQVWTAIPRLINGQPNPAWTAIQNQHPTVPLEDPVYVVYIKPTKASGESVRLPGFVLTAENIHHKVLWKVTDGCGNVDQCQSTAIVVDKKAPTPYCVHISTAIFQSNPKILELWAKDFDKGAFDNCSPQNKLYFTFDEIYPVFSKLNIEHFFKAKAGQREGVDATAAEYAQGRAQKWIPSLRSSGKDWTSVGITNIKVSVWDESWNTDYCEVELMISDNGGSDRNITGHVATAKGNNVSGAMVIFESILPEYPKQFMTDKEGDYSMEVQSDLDYIVHTVKGGDYSNGVTTLDLVIIQRHILGLETFDDPYKLIAADANNDGRITASDLSEIRKLILGVSDRFANESWRFPVKEQVMSMPNVFPYIEEYEYIRLNDNMSKQDFVAVKIGDVNESVELSLTNGSVEARSNERVSLSITEATLEAGELVEIPVIASNFTDVTGFQYTMNLKGASFVSIQEGALSMTTSNVGNLGNGMVTMSYAGSEGVSLNEGEVLFTMTVRADKATKVSEIFTIGSEVTKAESYNSDLKVGAISLEVRTATIASIELLQNEPNPFKGQTTVSFIMPEAGAATLSVYDMTGKQVVVRAITAVKGLNSEVFTKDQLGVSGVLYYTLESGDFTATKKMIIVE